MQADRAVRRRRTVIESLGVALPSREVSTAELIRGCRREVRFPLERMSGIRARRVAGEDGFAIDLAQRAIERCLAHSRHGADDVDLILSGSISRCDAPTLSITYEPATAVSLKHRLGLRRAIAFDIANACAGMWTGITIADALLSLGVIRCALVVSGEYITHLGTTAQIEMDGLLDPRLACLTLGDSGAAVLLESAVTDGAGFDRLDLQTFSRYAGLCVAHPTLEPHGGAIMHTDALALTDAATRHGAVHALATVAGAGWADDDFDHLVVHQTSRTGINGAVSEINRILGRAVCHPGVVIDNLERRGNTATTSHLVALAEHVESGRIRSGDRLIFAISGSGLSVGTALYTLDDLPDRLLGAAGATARRADDGEASHALPPVPCPRVRIESIGATPRDGVRRETHAMLGLAVEDCLARSAHPREALGLVTFAGTYRTRYVSEPAVAATLAGEVGINTGLSPEERPTLAFDVCNGAVGTLNACWVASRLLQAGRGRAALVTASEVDNNADRFPEHALGLEETASAMVLEPSPGSEGFGGFLFRSHGEHEGDFGARCVNRDGTTYLDVIRDPAFERHCIEAIAAAVPDLLAAEGLALADVARVFPPQASSGFITELAMALGIGRDRLVDVTDDGRDLASSSLPYALAHARSHGLVRTGDIGLFLGAGAGLQVGMATYVF